MPDLHSDHANAVRETFTLGILAEVFQDAMEEFIRRERSVPAHYLA